ncbi:helix-turn-helix domain-containing protein [Cellvibrio mixtus]|uniref:helix-turn-helix domain-containing protein n=1 Tax=Cellvibrio mixtus TaxID=39650 RepID=UPI001FD1D85A|nr:LysR family transcriptional regulator [Cellvibrio mixtus]
MNIRHLTFRLLQVYVAVVRSGSISQAAQQLHLTQPTVSLQVKRLSEAVGSLCWSCARVVISRHLSVPSCITPLWTRLPALRTLMAS